MILFNTLLNGEGGGRFQHSNRFLLINCSFMLRSCVMAFFFASAKRCIIAWNMKVVWEEEKNDKFQFRSNANMPRPTMWNIQIDYTDICAVFFYIVITHIKTNSCTCSQIDRSCLVHIVVFIWTVCLSSSPIRKKYKWIKIVFHFSLSLHWTIWFIYKRLSQSLGFLLFQPMLVGQELDIQRLLVSETLFQIQL